VRYLPSTIFNIINKISAEDLFLCRFYDITLSVYLVTRLLVARLLQKYRRYDVICRDRRPRLSEKTNDNRKHYVCCKTRNTMYLVGVDVQGALVHRRFVPIKLFITSDSRDACPYDFCVVHSAHTVSFAVTVHLGQSRTPVPTISSCILSSVIENRCNHGSSRRRPLPCLCQNAISPPPDPRSGKRKIYPSHDARICERDRFFGCKSARRRRWAATPI